MGSKTWTATDVALGKLTVHRFGSEIQVERRYQFLDAGGQILGQVAGGRVLETIPIAELPADVLAALQKIDAWTKQKALQQEGMA